MNSITEPTTRQVEIRDAPELGLLITAPAGCGKTEALALRARGMIDRGVARPPRRILVVTFTNRSRENIVERLAEYIPPNTLRRHVTVQNLHGLSARIIQAHGNVIGMDSGWQQPGSDWITDECRSRGLNFRQSSIVKGHFQNTKLQTRSDAEVAAVLAEINHPTAIEIEQKRKDEHHLTYDDLPRLADLILRNDDVALLYRGHFACVIVDEFQDLTLQQLSIIQRIGAGRITYAGDLAQGIYGFAGAAPEEVLALARSEVSREITFAESHRSSPAVLALVNSLTELTGGVPLTSSKPESWPGGGLSAHREFDDNSVEAAWIVSFARSVLGRAPEHRIGVIARAKNRRAALDELLSQETSIDWYRWDDPIFDSHTVPILRSILRRASVTSIKEADDALEFLLSLASPHELQDPSTRESVLAGCAWISDLVSEGATVTEITSRMRIGVGDTLLSASGMHLLTGHAGKGQQFDWVIVLGLEQDSIPAFQAQSRKQWLEEARVLSVMLSRARHGVITTRSLTTIKPWGDIVAAAPSTFIPYLEASDSYADWGAARQWLQDADWGELGSR